MRGCVLHGASAECIACHMFQLSGHPLLFQAAEYTFELEGDVRSAPHPTALLLVPNEHTAVAYTLCAALHETWYCLWAIFYVVLQCTCCLTLAGFSAPRKTWSA